MGSLQMVPDRQTQPGTKAWPLRLALSYHGVWGAKPASFLFPGTGSNLKLGGLIFSPLLELRKSSFFRDVGFLKMGQFELKHGSTFSCFLLKHPASSSSKHLYSGEQEHRAD